MSSQRRSRLESEHRRRQVLGPGTLLTAMLCAGAGLGQESGGSPESPDTESFPEEEGALEPEGAEGPGMEPTAPAATVDSDDLAQEMSAELSSGKPGPVPLEPPLPGEEAFDWLRFDSGEWIGGDLKEMRDGDVTFDSDKMDLVVEDWGDVIEFRSARRYTYVNTNLEYFAGPALVTSDVVLVRTDAGIVSFPRSGLLSIVANSNREIDRWSLKFSLAATARAGNTRSIDFNNFLRVRRQDKLTRGTLESTTNLGDVNGSRTVQNWNGSLKADVFFHRYFYVTPVFGSGQHNYFQNLLFRGALGGGGGTHAIASSWLSVDFDTVFAYQYTEYLSAGPMEPLAFDDAVLAFGTSVEWDITSDVDLDLDWRTYLVVTELGRTYHNGSARFSLEITDIFDFDLTAALNRIEQPVAGDDGVVPKSNDWTFTAGIGIELN